MCPCVPGTFGDLPFLGITLVGVDHIRSPVFCLLAPVDFALQHPCNIPPPPPRNCHRATISPPPSPSMETVAREGGGIPRGGGGEVFFFGTAKGHVRPRAMSKIMK